jgi:hypothetical protein
VADDEAGSPTCAGVAHVGVQARNLLSSKLLLGSQPFAYPAGVGFASIDADTGAGAFGMITQATT